MGGWSYQTFRDAPTPLIDAIITAINKEAELYGSHDDD
jgi:hypothetical protein